MLQKIMFSFQAVQIGVKVLRILFHIPFLKRRKKKKLENIQKEQKKVVSFSWNTIWKETRKEFCYFYRGVTIIKERFY